MEKIKVIDLLNKIANREDVPEKIKTNGYIYEYQGDDYLYIDKNNDNHEYWLFSESYANKFVWLDNFLNTEVEIIEDTFSGIKFYQNGEETCSIDIKPSFTTKDLHVEEDKKIEKLDLHIPVDNSNATYNGIFMNKINEIIDKINGDS